MTRDDHSQLPNACLRPFVLKLCQGPSCVGYHLRHFSDESDDPDLAFFDQLEAFMRILHRVKLLSWRDGILRFTRAEADLAGTLGSIDSTL